jgi:hypothetical protein
MMATYPKKPTQPWGAVQPDRSTMPSNTMSQQQTEAALAQQRQQAMPRTTPTYPKKPSMPRTTTPSYPKKPRKQRQAQLRVREPMRDMTMPFGKINY